MSNNIERYGIPGRIVPGLQRDFTNFRMTDLNNLRNASLTRPDIIEGLHKYFTESTGMVSELLMYTNKSYDKNVAKFKKEKYGEQMPSWQKNFKMLNNYEFAWQSPAPTGWVYQVTKAPTFVNDVVGFNHADFIFEANKQLGDKDDVMMLADGITQIILKKTPEPLPDGTIRFRASLFGQETFSKAIPRRLLEKGVEFTRVYNLKPEASEHGSKGRVSFGEWNRGWLSTMRWEWNITGHAAHVMANKTPQNFCFTLPNGKVEQYWTETWRMEMMKRAYIEQDNQLFWGMDHTTKDGGFYKDERGYKYWSGKGIYHQANRRLKREYTDLDDFTIIDDIMSGMYHDSLNTGRNVEIVVFGGLRLRTAFDKLLRNEFKGAPEILYFDGVGNYNSTGSGNIMGIKSNFTYYETPVGKFIMSDCDYFDRTSHPSLFTREGVREQSYRGIFMNISDMIGGEKAMTLVSLANRQNVSGKVSGMSNPGAGGTLSTTADVEGEHLLTSQGIAVTNPNFLGELSLARGRR